MIIIDDGVNTRSVENFSSSDGTSTKVMEILSSIEYYNRSVNEEKKIIGLMSEIKKSTEDLISIAYDIRARNYGRSIENDEGIQLSFGTNVKNWFIKVWDFVVKIFKGFINIITNLARSLVIYIKEFMIRRNSLYKKYNDNKKLIFDQWKKNQKIIEKVLENRYTINTPCGADFFTLYEMLQNANLSVFINTRAVQNNNSVINLGRLETLIQCLSTVSDSNDTTVENKLGRAIAELHDYTISSILFGEESGIGGRNMESVLYRNVLEAEERGTLVATDVNQLGNFIVYGQTNAETQKISMKSFFRTPSRVTTGSDIMRDIHDIFGTYTSVSDLVLGNNGYLQRIKNVMQGYKNVANRDAAQIKRLKDEFMKEFGKYDGKGDAGTRITNRFRTFTNILTEIQSIKNNFLATRQVVIGNILTVYAAIDKGVRTLVMAVSPDADTGDMLTMTKQDL